MPCAPGKVYGQPEAIGLYDPTYESDACGVGYVVNIDGIPSHRVLRDAQTMLIRMEHRGACGCDNDTGDGAGVLTGIPHKMYHRMIKSQGVDLPEAGFYATGIIFTNPEDVEKGQGMFTDIAKQFGVEVITWRNVPVYNNAIGSVAKTTEPIIKQCF